MGVSCVRDAEGAASEASRSTASPSLVIVIASPFLGRAKQSLIIGGVVPLRLLHFVRNDDKARIAEAIAKPGAARPEHTTAN